MNDKTRYQKLESALFGAAPVGSMIFMDEEKRAEWENLDPEVKKSSLQILVQTCKQMENTLAIEFLANVIQDLVHKIENLESWKEYCELDDK